MPPPSSPHPPPRSWVTKVEQFVQLSDLPQERSQASHLKCLGHVADAIAQTGGDRVLTDRVRQVGSIEAEWCGRLRVLGARLEG